MHVDYSKNHKSGIRFSFTLEKKKKKKNKVQLSRRLRY